MLVNIVYYIDVLEPVWIPSLALQKKKVEVVNSTNSLLKTKSELFKLEQRPEAALQRCSWEKVF